MRLKKDSVIPWGCVFKITFPNGKIYVGSDTAMTARMDYFKYFGTPIKAKAEMLVELGEYLECATAYIVKKEILHSEENVRVEEILKIERAFIKSLQAQKPSIGYNR
jgi:hypothetical protein